MKQDRIELRTSHEERLRLTEAASFAGQTLSSFLRKAALEKSDEILKNRDVLTLSDKDRNIFLEACENPPKPNKRLQQAFKTYEKKKNSNHPKASISKSLIRKRRQKPAKVR